MVGAGSTGIAGVSGAAAGVTGFVSSVMTTLLVLLKEDDLLDQCITDRSRSHFSSRAYESAAKDFYLLMY